MYKLVQKRTYDFCSQKYAAPICYIGLLVIAFSAFQFGETVFEWSKEKYSGVFSSYSDNIREKSLQSQLCQFIPVDIVYTWVNGSDPKLIEDLAAFRSQMESNENYISDQKIRPCPFRPCLDSHLVIIHPPLPVSLTPNDLAKLHTGFRSISKIMTKHSLENPQRNVSVIVLDSIGSAEKCAEKGFIIIHGVNHTITLGYLTTDWMAKDTALLEDTLILAGIPLSLTEDQIKEKMPRKIQPLISKIFLHRDIGIAVIIATHMMALESILQLEGNFTFGYRNPTFSVANLVIDYPRDRLNDDLGRSRFEDNEELRYSLRSLEKHAPWVRHIYLVTNGQIPYWLNLDNPRITLVSHQEIFPDLSHLPTFSSPAIETHLHRIPGLSQKFLYLNDDVMFGKDVWPDDFYSHARGQKIYLAWSVPDCHDGCPTSWISDGYCDKGCNNTECQWDGGDCLGGTSTPVQEEDFDSWQDELERLYCQPNCATMWIADKYCDVSCNIKECAFDGGDCGISEYTQMFSFNLEEHTDIYHLPIGVCQAYFNLSNFLGRGGSISSGTYEVEHDALAVRAIAINKKFKVLTLLLYEEHQASCEIMLHGERDNQDFQFKFSVTINTFPGMVTLQQNDYLKPALLRKNQITTASTTTIAQMNFETFPPKQLHPHLQTSDEREGLATSVYAYVNETAMELPAYIQEQLADIRWRLTNGALTEKGSRKEKAHILQEYFADLSLQKKSIPQLVLLQEFSSVRWPTDSIMQSSRSVKVLLGSTEAKDDFQQTKNRKNISQTKNRFLKRRLQQTHLHDTISNHASVDILNFSGRHLLDTFGDSLRHVNRLLNGEFGFEARKVPAHIAYMLDIGVMVALQARFPEAFHITSSHKIRSADDVQLAFAYFYFLMGERKPFDINAIFDVYDTDHSGTWADREMRTLLTRLYGVPVIYGKVKQFEEMIINCSRNLPSDYSSSMTAPPLEHYLDSNMPVVSKVLVQNCGPLVDLLKRHLKQNNKYAYEILGEEDVAFKMIQTNVSQVVKHLDDIRAKPKKFICLNDNIDHENMEAATIKAVLVDFYESMFPVPSQFELSPFYRNRFLYVQELNEWRQYRDFIRMLTYAALGFLMFFAVTSFFHSKIKAIWRRCFPNRRGFKTTNV